MGLDIMMFIEVFDHTEDRWRLYQEIESGPYWSGQLMGVLGGPSHEDCEVFETKYSQDEFSKGVKDILATQFRGGGAIDHSHLTLEELWNGKVPVDPPQGGMNMPIIKIHDITYCMLGGIRAEMEHVSINYYTHIFRDKVRIAYWFYW